MQRNNTYDIAKCWAIVSVIVYHVINIIFYNQIIHSFIDTYFLALFFFISGLLVKDDKVKCKLAKNEGSTAANTIHLYFHFQ